MYTCKSVGSDVCVRSDKCTSEGGQKESGYKLHTHIDMYTHTHLYIYACKYIGIYMRMYMYVYVFMCTSEEGGEKFSNT